MLSMNQLLHKKWNGSFTDVNPVSRCIISFHVIDTIYGSLNVHVFRCDVNVCPYSIAITIICFNFIFINIHSVKPCISGHARYLKECPLRRGVYLWEVKNVEFVFGWDQDSVSIYERYMYIYLHMKDVH